MQDGERMRLLPVGFESPAVPPGETCCIEVRAGVIELRFRGLVLAEAVRDHFAFEGYRARGEFVDVRAMQLTSDGVKLYEFGRRLLGATKAHVRESDLPPDGGWALVAVS